MRKYGKLNWAIWYLVEVLEGIDKLLNAVAGGNNEVTVSARCGHFLHKTGSKYWKCAAGMIDISFYPYQGWGHCELARNYEGDRFHREPELFGKVVFITGIFVVCVFLSIISYTYLLIKNLIDVFR